jgi:hypothetical protein
LEKAKEKPTFAVSTVVTSGSGGGGGAATRARRHALGAAPAVAVMLERAQRAAADAAASARGAHPVALAVASASAPRTPGAGEKRHCVGRGPRESLVAAPHLGAAARPAAQPRGRTASSEAVVVPARTRQAAGAAWRRGAAGAPQAGA